MEENRAFNAQVFIIMYKYSTKHLLAAAIISLVCSICLIVLQFVPASIAIWLLAAACLLTVAVGVVTIRILSRRSYSSITSTMVRHNKAPKNRSANKAEFLVRCDEFLTVINDRSMVETDLRFLKQIKQDGRPCTLDQFIHPDDYESFRKQILNCTFLVPAVTNVRLLAGDLSGDTYAYCQCRSIMCPYDDFTRQPAIKLTFTLASRTSISSSVRQELLKGFSSAVWEYDIKTDTLSYTPVSSQEDTFHLRGRMLIRHLEKTLILHPDFRHIFQKLRQTFRNGDGDVRTELKLMDISGDYRWYTLTGSCVKDQNNTVTGYVGQLRNTDNSSAGQITTSDPDTDTFTGLLNRHGLVRSFSRRIAETNLVSCAFLLLDVDNFNEIVNRLGKRFGDALLIDIAGLLKNSIAEDDIICHITKDVFALIMINPSSLDEVKSRAAQLSQAITHIHLNHERSEKVTCCMGISFCSDNINDYETMYYQADTALAYARSKGDNHLEFYQDELDLMLSSNDSLIGLASTEPSHDEQTDGDFLSQAIDVLSESRELSSSINIILSLIGQKYDLASCEILEFTDDYQSIYSTYRWKHDYNTGSEPIKCSVELIEEAIMLDSDAEYFLCTDIDKLAETHKDVASFYQNSNISSFLHIPIRDGLCICGLICFGAHNGKSVFTPSVTREIVLISKIMGGYIMRLRSLLSIDRISTTDALTGCMNLSRFISETKRITSEHPEQRYVIVYSDIDRFKFINETFGYLVGDRVLIEFSQIVTDILTDDEILGRIDADKFIALLKFDDRDKLISRLSSCDRKISTINDLTDTPYKIPLRCGIAHFTPDEEMTHIIDKANLARKSVKNIHVSTYTFYNESMKSRILQQKEIEDVMHEALEKGEFTVFLQPKFSLSQEHIVGAEALVRWNRPGYGLQRPDEFIPIFEDNGFVLNLDFYVLEQVCQKLRHDLDSGLTPYPISVNFSRLHLNANDFSKRLISCLEKYSIDPKYIEIEITESALIGNEDYLVEVMDSLHEVGLVIAMDDFGSGYSTLNLLKKLPVDILKIDKAFFAGSGSKRERLIIANVVNLAKSLDICVVSEGVETLEQAQFLRQVHCDIAQGYLYAHPMDIDTYESTYQQTPPSA